MTESNFSKDQNMAPNSPTMEQRHN